MIYFDNAATTYPKPEAVYEKMDLVNRNLGVNAGRGGYKLARKATELIDDTKERLLKLTNAGSGFSVAFQSSITAALNQIIQGIDYSLCKTIYMSAYEHNAVARTVNLVRDNNPEIDVEILPMKEDLTIDLDKMKYMFSQKKPDFLILNMMSNVTGYVLPYEEIFREAKKYNCITALDSAQGLGLIDIDLKGLYCDVLAFAGHKSLYGPLGVGGLIIKDSLTLKPLEVGGNGSDSLNLSIPKENSRRYEFSSQNIVAIAGLNEALNQLEVSATYAHEMALTDYAIEQLKGISDITVYQYSSDNAEQVAVISFVVEGFSSEDIGMILDEDYDICVRTGYHCAPFIHEYLKDKEYAGTVRIGIGRFNTKADIDALVEAVKEICEG